MKITNWLFKNTQKTALLIFILVLIFFSSTIPKVNVGYADSDEFLAVAPHWGIAHPPGYSLYVGTLNLAMKLPVPNTTPAFRAHFISAVASALAIALTIPLAKRLYIMVTPSKRRSAFIYTLALLTTILSLATSKQIWLYSQITEKYLFATPLVIGFITLGFDNLTSNKPKISWLLLMSLLFGLSVGHHQSLIFLSPFWLIAVILPAIQIKSYLKPIGTALMGLSIGLGVSFLLLWIQINRQSTLPISWYAGDGLTGLLNHLTRQDFRGEIYMTNVISNGYTPTQLKLSPMVAGATNYFVQLAQSFGWWIFLPLIISTLTLLQKKHRPLLFIFLPFILIGPLLATYLGWPEDIGTQAITQRFYLIGYFTLLPLLFIGFTTLLTRINLGLAVLSNKWLIHTGILLIIPLLLIRQAVGLYSQISLKHFDLVSRLYSGILSQVKPNSVITCYSDTSCFALLYEQSVNRLRPDVQVVPLAYPLIHNQLATNKLERFTYPDNPFKLFDIVTNSIGKRPIYAVDMNQYYSNLFGIRNGFMFYIPDGYKAELARRMPEHIIAVSDELPQSYAAVATPTFDLYRQFLIESFAQTHISNAYIHLKRGERTQAQQLLNTAANLSDQLLPQLAYNTQAARLEIEQTLPDKNFAPGNQVIDSNTLLQAVPQYLQAGRNASAYAALLGSISINPESIPARLELANMYQQMGDYQFAKLEYQHVLILDPDNQQALDQLNRLP